MSDPTPKTDGPQPSESKASATEREPKRRTKTLLGIGVVVSALAVFGIAWLLMNISDRKDEAEQTYFQAVQLDDTIVDPAVWGKNFPTQYDSYTKTLDMGEGVHGGSEALPQVLTEDSPLAKTTTESKIEVDPRLVTMWEGYAFSKDYRELRGHAYMLHDQRVTKRVEIVDQPGACLNCHASTYKMMNDLGGGDINKGFAVINKTPYNEITKQAEHPIACIDCHDPKTMELRVTRPAFMNGIKALKASQGIKDYDVNRDASNQEMRAYVCGQCHVEYYFKGEGKTLTYPWSKGLNIDNEYAYYEEEGFTDWTHKTTGAPMLKAQHPEFELWNQGVHASAGVTCADCHMPYKREGASKVSDHQVTSPMKNINASCQTCHHTSEAELQGRVKTIQDRHLRTRDTAQEALDQLIKDIVKAKADKVDAKKITEAHKYQRKASFYIDYIVSENSKGFHAPGESLRVLNDATDAARKGQLALRDNP